MPILCSDDGFTKFNAHKIFLLYDTHKAFSSVVHEVELKPVLLSVALGQRMAKDIRRNGGLITVLELSEQILSKRGRDRWMVGGGWREKEEGGRERERERASQG